jgi:hypothetical protein
MVHLVGRRPQELKLELLKVCGVTGDEAEGMIDVLPANF